MAEVMLKKEDKKELDDLLVFLEEIGKERRKELKGFILGAKFIMDAGEMESKSM